MKYCGYNYWYDIAADQDFSAVSRIVVLPRSSGAASSTVCSEIPALNDSLAFEGEEEFGVSLEIVGSDNGRLEINGGRGLVILEMAESLVVIMDINGEIEILLTVSMAAT